MASLGTVSCFAGVCAALLAGACSDEDAKKNPGKGGSSGTQSGEAGPGGAGGTGAVGGAAGASGSAGEAGSGATAGEAGTGASAGAGAGGVGGSGGAPDAGDASADGPGGDGGGCPSGFGDCDGNSTNGCETPVDTVTQCGSCTTACDGTNGTVSCQSGACVVESCTAGFGDCDGDPNTGCETSLVSNDTNCGECGRDCTAASTTCSTDACVAVPLQQGVPIGSDNGNARSWAFDGSALYQVGYYGYTVRRLPVSGSAATTVWTAPAAYAGTESLLVQGTDVLWAERGTPSVVLRKNTTAAAATLPTVVFTPAFQPQYLRIQGGNYYWASGDYQSGDTNGFIYTRPVSAPASDPGTAIVTVNQGVHGAILGFMPTSDALYWVTNDAGTYELRTAPLAGGTPTAVPGGAVSEFFASGIVSLQPAGNTIYFNRVVGTSFLNGIYRFAAGDATPTQLVVAPGVNSLLVDATSIYYSQRSEGGVFKVPLAGGAGVQIAATTGVTELVGQDATYLYVAASSCCATDVFKIVK